MSYTDDFKNARFAEHPDGRLAKRDGSDDFPWVITHPDGTHDRGHDRYMAVHGWTPVRERPPVSLEDFMIRAGEDRQAELHPQAAQVEATLALAFEARTQALIAYAQVADDETADRLWVDHITPRLGLDGDES